MEKYDTLPSEKLAAPFARVLLYIAAALGVMTLVALCSQPAAAQQQSMPPFMIPHLQDDDIAWKSAQEAGIEPKHIELLGHIDASPFMLICYKGQNMLMDSRDATFIRLHNACTKKKDLFTIKKRKEMVQKSKEIQS